jgi:restriction system protein
MAAQKIPTDTELYGPVLKALKALDGSGTIREIEAKVAQLEGFSEEQLAVLHKGGPRSEVNYRMAWARTYLKAVDALENSTRGVWAITEEGRRLTEADMASVVPRAREALAAKRAARRGSQRPGSPEESDGEPAAWRDKLLLMLQSLPPDAFERLAQRLLREAGFISVEVKGRSGDGGIDGVGVLRVSLLSFPVFFQCKRYRGSVGPAMVRDFRGAMAGRGDKGILITTGTFTREAQIEAGRDGAPPIDLVDGDQLCDLLKDYRLGVSVERVESEQVTVRPEWYKDI